MRLLRYEGTVTMDELSRSEFNQKGKYLNLNLTKGSIFFEVDKSLAENESLIITDGKVHVIGTNPVTGEVKEIDVKAGQRIYVYLYNDREVDSIMFVLEDITERDLPLFVIRMLRENPELLDKVVRETGWDKPWILGITDAEEPEEEPETKPDQSDPVVTDPVEPEPIVVADLEPDDGNGAVALNLSDFVINSSATDYDATDINPTTLEMGQFVSDVNTKTLPQTRL